MKLFNHFLIVEFLTLWAFKVLLGIVYYYIHIDYYAGGDTLLYVEEATKIYSTFWEYPTYYLEGIMGQAPEAPIQDLFIYPTGREMLRHLGTYVLVHWQALLMLITGPSYFMQIGLLAFFTTWASLSLCRTLSRETHLSLNLLVGLCCFTPSIAFWTAGIHKDAYQFILLSCLIQLLLIQVPKRKDYLLIFLVLLGLGCIRPYLYAILLPSLAGFYLLKNYPSRQRSVKSFFGYSAIVIVSLALINIGFYVTNGTDLIEVLSYKHTQFLNENMRANTSLSSVHYTTTSLVFELPIGLFKAIFRPTFVECTDALIIAAFIEIIGLLFLIVIYLRNSVKAFVLHPIFYFLFIYAIIHLCVIGLLVPNAGTIVRYRSIPLLFLIISLFIRFIPILKSRNK